LGVVDLDTPSIRVIKISSSCDLSTFSLKANSRRDKGAGAMPEESSSPSIGELWPDINKLDEINHGGNSVESLLGGVLHGQSSLPSVVRTNKNAKPAAKRVMVDDAPRPLTTLPGGGCGQGSARNNVAWILSVAPGAISPRMRRPFVDRQYSPSTNMDQSEWEIILEELTRMGYIVKEEPKSDGGE
jgi:hypothetical protein